jgi:type I restriction enzyme S subunit
MSTSPKTKVEFVEIGVDSELPEGWTVAHLDDICEAPQYGWTTSAKKSGAGLRLLRTTDISSGTVEWGKVPVCEDEPQDPSKYLLHSGDIVVSRAGSVGLSYMVCDCPPAVFASYLIRFRPLKPIRSDFVNVFLKAPQYWSQIAEETLGIAIPNVNGSKLRALNVPIPPFAEQQRIVIATNRMIPEVEAVKHRLGRASALLRYFRQAVLSAACSGKLTEDWRVSRGRTNETAAELPPEWKAVELKKIADTIDPNPSHRYPSYKNGTVPIFATEQMKGFDGWEASGAKLVTASFHAERERAHGFKRDDIIFARKGRLGLARRAPSVDKYVFSHTMFIIRTHPGTLSDYLLLCLRQDACVGWLLNEMNPNTGVPTLGKSYMERLPIQLPPPDEQVEIVRRVGALFELADEIGKRIAAASLRAERLTQAILSRAFRGELVPTEAELARREGRDYEPAEVLLARIKAETAKIADTEKAVRHNPGPRRQKAAGSR